MTRTEPSDCWVPVAQLRPAATLPPAPTTWALEQVASVQIKAALP